jgi:D-sedoheptulose 7-phosphate isomerase
MSKKNNIYIIAKQSLNITEFAKLYFEKLSLIFNKINFDKLINLEKILIQARARKKNIFIFGNGGSAATASTMANDLGFDILKKTSTKLPFKFFSLTDNTPVLTAIANDIGYENVLVSQLKIHFKKGDIVILISASGNSKNLLKASKWIKKNNGYIFSFLGFNGGKLKSYSNDYILVNTEKGEYGPVEDIHLIINHILAHWFQFKLKKN